MSDEELKRVREVADAAVSEIHNLKGTMFADEAINWGDFGVVSVEEQVLVSLEEGESNKAVLHVSQRLREAGFDMNDIDVRCDW